MKPDIIIPLNSTMETRTMAGILHRWGPGKLWAVYDEDGDLDTYVRAETMEQAFAKAEAEGCEGDISVIEVADNPEERAEYAAGDIALLLATVRRLADTVGARVDDFGGTHCPICKTVDGNGLRPACPTCGWVGR